MLTINQETVLIAAIKASSDPVLAPLVISRDNVLISDWLNSSSTVNAWHESCNALELFQASDITKFDNLTAGKRDAWRLMLDFAPHDMRINANRKAIVDIWEASTNKPGDDAPAVLTKCLRKATNGENILGGTKATSDTVTAIKLDFIGHISVEDISKAFNANP